jgi:hypothetical protein
MLPGGRPRHAQQGQGVIINFSSIAGAVGVGRG